MGGKPSTQSDKHVVVVGGGYGGVTLASKLKKAGVHFTLISARDAMHHNIASVRAPADESECFYCIHT